MKKTESKIVEKTITTCDECGREISNDSIGICGICGKEVHKNGNSCSEIVEIKKDSASTYVVVCKSCFVKGDFQKTFDEYHRKYEDFTKMRDEAMKFLNKITFECTDKNTEIFNSLKKLK